MPRNSCSGRNCKQFRRFGRLCNLLQICKQTKSIIRVDVLRIYFTIPVTVSHCPTRCHEISLFEFSQLPYRADFAAARGISSTRHLEERGRIWKNLVRADLDLAAARRISFMTTGKKLELWTILVEEYSWGILSTNWARTSFGSGIRTHWPVI